MAAFRRQARRDPSAERTCRERWMEEEVGEGGGEEVGAEGGG